VRRKKALIFGATGQDGSYLIDLLLKKNYIVHGVKRRGSSPNTSRLDHLYSKDSSRLRPNFYSKGSLTMHYGDLLDNSSLHRLIVDIKPDEIYNLAAQSHVKISSEIPEYTANVNGIGVLKLLEIIKSLKREKKIKFYQASSSEMFGNTLPPQNENSKFSPQSIYAISKLFAYNVVKYYREAYGLFASNGILFNHESPRRTYNFVTKKIINALKNIKEDKQKKLFLGNLYSKRDWGHAKDYVEAMWKIMQLKSPIDLVISTNSQISVKQFVNESCRQVGIKIKWVGKGLNEKAINLDNNKIIIEVKQKYFRDKEVNSLCGDFTKAKKIIKWKPKYKIRELISDMISGLNID
jgi:GDPmannose 4,6-dehydratase